MTKSSSSCSKLGWSKIIVVVSLALSAHFLVVTAEEKVKMETGPSSQQDDVVTIEAATGNPIKSKFGGLFYSGSRVGPFFLFRSSAKNAQLVKDNFRNQPIMRTFGLAFGDEFPQLRDELIRQKPKSRRPQPFVTEFQRTIATMTKGDNWRFDLENNKKEREEPFMRPTRILMNSFRNNLGRLANSALRPTTDKPNFKITIDDVEKKV